MTESNRSQEGAAVVDAAAAASALLAARRPGAEMVTVEQLVVDGDASSVTPDQAYAVQDALADRHGGRQVGWKIGMTNDERRAAMGLGEPTCGRLFDDMLLHVPARLPASLRPRLLEPELVVRVHSRLSAECTRHEIAAATTLSAGIEVVSSRLSGWPDAPVWCAIADNSAAECVVVSATERQVPAEDVADITVTFSGPAGEVNGIGSVILGHPLDAVRWLQRHLNATGRGSLKKGDLVFTGGLTVAVPSRPGRFRAEYSHGLGSIEMEVDG